jgi:superfamily I DNA/RNA helicase
MDDVLATAELARVLATRAHQGREERMAWIQANLGPFERLARALDGWAEMKLRPGDLIRELKNSLMKHKVAEPRTALPRLEELGLRLDAMDEPELSPAQSLRRALATAALVREGEGMDTLEGVRVLTIHQSKGLEFTRVFLPQLVQNVLPSFMVLKNGDPAQLAEERRLLYVAMTRAKRRLYLSWHGRNAHGYQAEPSTFLGELLGN